MSEGHQFQVTGFVRDPGACGKYRISQPLSLCAEQNLFKTRLIDGGDNHAQILDKLSESHLVVIPRPYDTVMLDMMDTLQKHDVKVVVDFDDNMFHISPWSVHYAEFGTEEVSVQLNGKTEQLWVDEKNIDLKLNKARLDGFKMALDKADAVSVTQPVLARAYQPYNDKVICLPNCVDSNAWKKLTFKDRDTVRILWSGGSSHYQDVYILKNVLPAICKKYPQVRVVVMGCTWSAIFGKIPPEQFEFHDWVHIEAYPYKHASLDIDISLVPLEVNDFNKGKSHIKMIEQCFLQVPTIVSMTTPYREFYETNNMVMVNNDDASWIEGISRLVEDATLRKEIGQKAYNCAVRDFEANDKAKLWAEEYFKLVA